MIAMKKLIQLSIVCCLTVIVSTSNIGNDRQDINLSDDGGYADILIAISERVPEDPDIITKLQSYFTEASTILHNATRGRLYFKNITIVPPSEWTTDASWEQAEDDETFRRARVVVAGANSAYGNVPYTLQPGGCGEEGDYIHFTPEYLTQNMSGGIPFKPANRIVKEFSQLKWGLFDETIPVSDLESPRFYNEDNNLKPVGCIERAFIYLTDPAQCTDFTETGVLNYPCDFTLAALEGKASLLSYEYWDGVTDFCDDESAGVATAHNKLATNLQNKNCDERSAWEVMNTLPDFEVDYNALRSSVLPPDPIFRIAQKPKLTTTTTSTSTTTTPTTSTAPPTTTTPTTSTTPPTTTTPTTSTIPPTTATIPTTTTTETPTSDECEQDIVCMCLDVSTSMDTSNRIGIMSDAVKTYILQYLRNQTAVGVVSFSNGAYLNADMTDITSDAVRNQIASQVPDRTIGGTNIGVGLLKCQEILRAYAGNDVDKTRIVLFSDGQGSIGNAIEEIIADGIALDTVLYDQGGFLSDQAKATGGQEFFASDTFGELQLAQFFSESASIGCDPENSDAVLQNNQILILAGVLVYTDIIYFDVTIGLNTKLVFKYTEEVNVSISVDQDLTVTYTRNNNLKTITVVIEGEIDNYLTYTVTKLVDISIEVSAIVTVTSSPIPGVQQIVVNDRVNNNDINFTASIQLIGYLGVFQGLTPVLQLTVTITIEQPNGNLLVVTYSDDGTGKDSVPNDGIYTGFVPAHNIDGSGGTYFGVTLGISGEGVLPVIPTSNRKKRCANCNSLGNITRSSGGGVIVIDNWSQVDDTTPPEKITDLRVLNSAASVGDSVFTIGWTAPGDDLNIGTVSGYEFAVSGDGTVSSQVSLPTEAILSNTSAYLVKAGSSLQMRINTSEITPTVLGLSQSANINTYYFRMRTFDAKNNFANWSNPASASYVSPATFSSLVASVTTTTTIPSTSTAQSPEVVTKGSQTTIVLAATLSTAGFIVIAVVIGAVVMKGCSSEEGRKHQSRTYGYRESDLRQVYGHSSLRVSSHYYAEPDRHTYYNPSYGRNGPAGGHYDYDRYQNAAYY